MTDREQFQKQLRETKERLNARIDKEAKRAAAAEKREKDLARQLREAEPALAAAAARRAEEESLERRLKQHLPVRWEVGPRPPKHGPGLPFLLLSDLHLNESVVRGQVQGYNEFNPDVARARLEETFKTAVHLAKNHMVRPEYESGIYVPVAGDIIDTLQGRVHEGERLSSPRMMDAVGMSVEALAPGFVLLKEAFGTVVSPWVSGNHDRLGRQLPFHDRSATSLSYAIYRELVALLTGKLAPAENEGQPVEGNGFKFMHAPGPRIVFTVYPGTEFEYRYLLLHGDPASGMPSAGNGYAGFIPTITAGVRRLRAQQAEIGLPFDTALLGHFHMYAEVPGAIVNGSLPGFAEYAQGKSLAVDRPQQAFWFHHPQRRITCRWPISLG